MGLISFIGRRFTSRIGVEHRRFRELTGTVLEGERPQCPKCRRGRLQVSPDDAGLRICDDPECGARIPLLDLAEVFAVSETTTAAVAARERLYAVQLTIGGQVFLLASAAWAVGTGSWATLLGAVLIGVMIFAMALVARYRAWQIEHGRMFERRAPFGAYLSWELAGVLHRR